MSKRLLSCYSCLQSLPKVILRTLLSGEADEADCGGHRESASGFSIRCEKEPDVSASLIIYPGAFETTWVPEFLVKLI